MNNTPSTIKRLALLAAGLAPFVACSDVPLLNDITVSSETVEVDEQLAPIGKTDATAIHDQGQALIERIAEARAALSRRDSEAATTALEAASGELDKLEALRPTIKLAYEIYGDGEEAAGVSSAKSQILPLIDRVGQTSEVIVDPRIREIADDAPIPRELLDSMVLYSEVDLPVAATKLDIAAALGFVKSGELDDAAAVLDDTATILTPRVLVADAPIVKARDHLLRVRAAIARADFAGAKAELAEARTALAAVASGADAPVSVKRALASYRGELDELDRSIGADSKGADLTLSRLLRSWSALARYQSSIAADVSAERAALSRAIVELEMARYFADIDSAFATKTMIDARRQLESLRPDPASKPLIDSAISSITTLETARGNAARDEREHALFELRKLYYHMG